MNEKTRTTKEFSFLIELFCKKVLFGKKLKFIFKLNYIYSKCATVALYWN